MHNIRSASKQGLELIPLDLEQEKIVREKKKQTVILKHSPSKMEARDLENDPLRQPVLQNPQNGHRTMRDFVSPNVQGDQTPIVRPAVAANNFEIKPAMIQMI